MSEKVLTKQELEFELDKIAIEMASSVDDSTLNKKFADLVKLAEQEGYDILVEDIISDAADAAGVDEICHECWDPDCEGCGD